jgi:hypothetical protein
MQEACHRIDGGAKSLGSCAKNTVGLYMRDSSMAKLVQNWTLFHFGAAKLARRD